MSCKKCRNVYTSTRLPKELPCGHDFCIICLNGQRKRRMIACPTCNATTGVDPHVLPTLRNLIDRPYEPPLAAAPLLPPSSSHSPPESRSIKILVKTSQLESIYFQLDSACTVKDLKELIERRTTISANQQTLSFNTLVLDNDRSLQEYGIEDNSLVTQTISTVGGY